MHETKYVFMYPLEGVRVWFQKSADEGLGFLNVIVSIYTIKVTWDIRPYNKIGQTTCIMLHMLLKSTVNIGSLIVKT